MGDKRDMLREFVEVRGKAREDACKSLVDRVRLDWPAAAEAMERLGQFLGDMAAPAGESPEAVSRPLAFSAYEKALAAYQEVLTEEDPVRLTALVEAMLSEAADGLAKVEVVDAIGRVWNPTEGTPLAEWKAGDKAPVEVRKPARPTSREDIYDVLAAYTVDRKTRSIIDDAKDYYPNLVEKRTPRASSAVH